MSTTALAFRPGDAPRHPRGAAEIPASRTVTLSFDDNGLLPLLYGEHDRNLALIETRLGVRLGSRGNRLTISGPPQRTEVAEAALADLWRRLQKGEHVGSPPRWRPRCEWLKACRRPTPPAAAGHPGDPHPQGRHRPALAHPGRLYGGAGADEMVFGVGPAGTGKTYLAMAMAVGAAEARKVERIVLSRPAVEAGERLGFLPGDLAEKVIPISARSTTRSTT